jgi:hypothetical protein
MLPKSPRHVIDAPLPASFTIPRIQNFLLSSQIMRAWDENIVIGAVTENVWSRSARRRARNAVSANTDAKLAFRITVKDMQDASEVAVEWRVGFDFVLFESFCGKLKSIVHQE